MRLKRTLLWSQVKEELPTCFVDEEERDESSTEANTPHERTHLNALINVIRV